MNCGIANAKYTSLFHDSRQFSELSRSERIDAAARVNIGAQSSKIVRGCVRDCGASLGPTIRATEVCAAMLIRAAMRAVSPCARAALARQCAHNEDSGEAVDVGAPEATRAVTVASCLPLVLKGLL